MLYFRPDVIPCLDHLWKADFPGGVFIMPEIEVPQSYAENLISAPLYVCPHTLLHFHPDFILSVAHLLMPAFPAGAFTCPEKEETLNMPEIRRQHNYLPGLCAVLHYRPEFIHCMAHLRTVIFSWRWVYKPSKGGASEIYRNSDASTPVCLFSVLHFQFNFILCVTHLRMASFFWK